MAEAESSHRCRLPKPLKPDLGRHFHCPIQTSEDDLPKIKVDIHGDYKYYLKALEKLQQREILIAPFIIQLPGCRVHVTPLGVPFPKKSVTKSDSKGKGKGKAKKKVKAKGKEEPEEDKIISSFHIIQLFSSKDEAYLVELLMRDENLYFVAFRRHVLVLSDSEKTRGTKLGPGNWYAFSNEICMLPEFIDATEIKMHSNYSEPILIKPGGSEEALYGIFLQLTQFESHTVVTKVFRQAMYSVMQLYCEGRRSRVMQREMSRRIEHGEEPSKLSELLAKTIRMWKSFSGMVLDPLADGTIIADSALPGVGGGVLPFKTIADLIGVVDGELLIAKLHVRFLGMTESELKAEEEKARKPGYVKNHPFPV